MCDVQEDMRIHLVHLKPADKGNKIEHKQASDSVITMTPLY